MERAGKTSVSGVHDDLQAHRHGADGSRWARAPIRGWISSGTEQGCIAYIEYGDPKGLPVIYCHGFPSSSREAQFLHLASRAEHLRIIAPDRPGYGGSDFQPRRTIIGWARDVEVLANHLGLGRFAMLGVSGGAPYALACTWQLSERIIGCALVCPLGPVYLKPVLAQMSRAARLNFSVARRAPLLSKTLFGPLATRLLSAWPQIVNRVRRLSASDTDLAELENPRTRFLLDQAIAGAIAHGARGVRQDLLLYTRDWGIPMEQIDLAMDIWHGEADQVVPISHSCWYAASLRNAQLHRVSKEGHYSLPIRHSEEIVGTLSCTIRKDRRKTQLS